MTEKKHDEKQVEYMKEGVILLDACDNVIGNASKFKTHKVKNIKDGLLHRAFSVFIFNNEGKLLLQKRASEKITFPDVWTNTCCSHPLYVEGEVEDETTGVTALQGVINAAQRKLEHELGIKPKTIKDEDFNFLTRIHYSAFSDEEWGEHEIDYILFVQCDVDKYLNVNANEISHVKYVSQDDLTKMIDQSIIDAKDVNKKWDDKLKMSPWFSIIKDAFLYKWWDNLENIINKKYEKDGKIHVLSTVYEQNAEKDEKKD